MPKDLSATMIESLPYPIHVRYPLCHSGGLSNCLSVLDRDSLAMPSLGEPVVNFFWKLKTSVSMVDPRLAEEWKEYPPFRDFYEEELEGGAIVF